MNYDWYLQNWVFKLLINSCTFKVVWDTSPYLQGWKILKYDYDQGFKNFKIYYISPENIFIKFHKRDKK